MDFDRAELLLKHLTEIADQPPYDESERLLLSRTLAITSLEYAASVRTLCEAGLLLGACTCLRSQFEALVRSAWAIYSASDMQVEKLSALLSLESQQANKNIPQVSEMLEQLGKFPKLENLLIPLREFKDSSWQPLNSFVHAGIHAIQWTKIPPPPQLLEQTFKVSNAMAVTAFQSLAILTGQPTLQAEVIAATASFSGVLPSHR